MLNRGLLFTGMENAIKPGSIGRQGQLGFGGGVYGGAPSDLEAIGLSPMPDNNDPTNENYGSYKHTNGSVMLFIPAFCYRSGRPTAPSYDRDGENALEIKDATELGMPTGSTDVNWTPGDGWTLHRAFIDGGALKSGFFVDKYLCSKDATGNLAVSVKNGDPIALCGAYVKSSSMPDCVGQLRDAITLGRARGKAYSCTSVFMYSAISMLSLAHGQAAKNTDVCAWFDSTYQTNFPKGNNNDLSDINDGSVTFVHAQNSSPGVAKTGSASNLAKTTHTGQVWGATDINGNMRQPCIGWAFPEDGNMLVAKESVSMHSFTINNRNDTSLFDVGAFYNYGGTYYWGASAFYDKATGPERALCGVYPRITENSGSSLFGNDIVCLSALYDRVLCVSGCCVGKEGSGVFKRNGSNSYTIRWEGKGDWFGLRIGGYAK